MTRFRNALLVLVAGAPPRGLRPPPIPPRLSRGGTLTIVRPTDPGLPEPNLETTAPGAWVYFNMLEAGFPTLDARCRSSLSGHLHEVMSPTRVRFALRPGVKFRIDGTPLNAPRLEVHLHDRARRAPARALGQPSGRPR